MTINAIIERANDGGYWAYSTEETAENVLGCGFNGYGDTPAEAMDDLKLSIQEMREVRPDLPENIEVSFSYDVSSFLRSFKGSMTLAGLEHVTGINQKQLQRYMAGGRRPSEKTVRKIEEAVHQFGATLMNVSFA